ncbi:DUF3322 domain-containing protein [Thiocapsa roseopersicina]|uniref:Wadjet protein JetD C-terminal domain-containing protein n=1 Tax=Thiocapsa roseopersicina TaxID=1058 RepID=A0A1H2SN87_THIRO|nr:DUF3322 domain-containing protein [Thiocapsa roseopersicina]SDW32977.1 hypothetical protein SAMN05421783_10359 [Thiocapsa roseopersicina]
MSWTTAADLKTQLNRLWERGELLRPLVADGMTGASGFPLRLRLKGPGSADLADRFEAVRAWIAELVAIPRLRITWRAVNHRVLGPQRLPEAIWVDTLDDALALIGKRGDAARFSRCTALTRSRQPALLDWLAKRPLQAIALAEDWERLLAVVDWLSLHPRPGIYIRQVDIPGIHSKFIEAHRGVLSELLDLVLPAEAVAADRFGVGRFAARYGFLDKPNRVRFRLLDDAAPLLPGPGRADVALDAESFARLAIPIQHVFITENETNFLSFPDATASLAVFGAGYGWDALARAKWLGHCTLHYWGDIDTHGFAILDQLRGRFGRVASFLMDRATLMAHETLWGEESDQVMHDLPRLTASERALFDDLRDNRIRKGVRLEQERVGFRWVETALADALLENSGRVVEEIDSIAAS